MLRPSRFALGDRDSRDTGRPLPERQPGGKARHRAMLRVRVFIVGVWGFTGQCPRQGIQQRMKLGQFILGRLRIGGVVVPCALAGLHFFV